MILAKNDDFIYTSSISNYLEKPWFRENTAGVFPGPFSIWMCDDSSWELLNTSDWSIGGSCVLKMNINLYYRQIISVSYNQTQWLQSTQST